MNLQPYQQLVVEEKAELDDKCLQLRQFCMSDLYSSLSGEEKKDLLEQRQTMDRYSSILARRVNRFTQEIVK